jgi:hypothetical protein
MRLVIEGSRTKVSGFTQLIQKLAQYRFYHQSQCPLSSEELRCEYYFDERSPLPPSLTRDDVNTLTITDTNQQEIKIQLLGCNMVEMRDGTTIIYGKSYDIFAG